MTEKWINLTMKFPGKCMVCGKPIPKGQQGLWSRGVGVKHAECAADSAQSGSSDDSGNGGPPPQSAGITCAVCGKPAGCTECELLDTCDLGSVSKNCLCYTCGQKSGVMDLYRKSVSSRYPLLSGGSGAEKGAAAASGTLL